MFDQYSKHIRPEMLKLLTFLKGHITTTNKQTGFQTPLPIRIEAGAERIEIDNTAGWFVGALEEYLHTFLGGRTKNGLFLQRQKIGCCICPDDDGHISPFNYSFQHKT